MSNPLIFISYSHRDESWKDKLQTHLGVLERQGEIEVWDDRKIKAGDDWNDAIIKSIETASVAVLLISADFLNSEFILGEEIPRLLKRRQNDGMRIIPIIVRPCAWKKVNWLSQIQCHPKDGRPLNSGTEFQVENDIALIVEDLSSSLPKSILNDNETQSTLPLSQKITTSRLPSTPYKIFGRSHELLQISEAWEKGQTNVLSITAFGGTGKSALINHWLIDQSKSNYLGAKVYCWSFYNQGIDIQRHDSAEEFIDDALEWFGDPPTSSISYWQKGRRLANLIQRDRVLLILDGLEPLQYSQEENGEMFGQIRDRALQSLIRELALHNPGLCILTSRLKFTDLINFPYPQIISINLNPLTEAEGASYLQFLGVQGSESELRSLSREFGFHALSLSLLGNYLRIACNGDARKKDMIANLFADTKTGGHAWRMLSTYENYFEGKPALQILRLLSLFDRPISMEVINYLIETPPIPGFTDKLIPLATHEWAFEIESLRDLGLMALQTSDEALDCHPLLREYFANQIKEKQIDGWKEAHRRLFHYYSDELPNEYLPDTLRDLTPLYLSIKHGCLAGLYKEAFDVYWKRICRELEFFSTNRLGAFGTDLVALTSFFYRPWQKPIEDLSLEEQALLLGMAGYRLRSAARFEEANQAFTTNLQIRKSLEDWTNVSSTSENLGQMNILLGDINKAKLYFEDAVFYSIKSNDKLGLIVGHAGLASAIHQLGEIENSESLFNKAETIQSKITSEFQYLYSISGVRYCFHLIYLKDFQNARLRAKYILEIANNQGQILDRALGHLILGIISINEYFISSNRTLIEEAELEIDSALEILNSIDDITYLPLGMISRATLERARVNLQKSKKTLTDALSLAERNQMMLYVCDCHIELSKVNSALGEKHLAIDHYRQAKEIIAKTSYYIRNAEINMLGEEFQ